MSAMNLEQISRLSKEWIIPPAFLRLRREIGFRRAIKLTACASAILSRNARFHNMYAGRRCFVIGNGPSLNKQDLSPLADEITITMNFFNRHPILEKWKPTFFCMADPLYIQKPEILPDFLYNIEAEANFFLIGAKDIFDKGNYLDMEKVYYLKMTGGALYDWPVERRGLDLTMCLPGVRSTAHMAIMIALYIGCSPIYLLGLDQSLSSTEPPQRHFYPDPPGTYIVSDNVHGQRCIDGLEGTLLTFSSFEALRRMGSCRGCAILNATGGGALCVFERVNYEEIIRSRK